MQMLTMTEVQGHDAQPHLIKENNDVTLDNGARRERNKRNFTLTVRSWIFLLHWDEMHNRASIPFIGYSIQYAYIKLLNYK